MEPPETTRPMVDLLLRFKTSVRYRMEDYFGEENIKESGDGRFETTISFPKDEWIYSFLLSFGDEIEVISPKHVRKEILKILKKITALYQNPDIQVSQE